jgi:predicted nucleic acid-binding protein
MASRISQMIGKVDDVIDEASESGLRVSKEKIINNFPSEKDFIELAAVQKEAEGIAREAIETEAKKSGSKISADAYKEAKEIVDSSEQYADWTDLVSKGGLNLETAHMMSDPETIKQLLMRRPTLFQRGAKTHAEHFAMEKGFDTPDELFQHWLNQESRPDVIKRVANDIIDESAIGAEMGERVGGESRQRFIERTIEEENKLLSKIKPKGTGKTELQEIVKTKQIPGDEGAAEALKTARTHFKKEVIGKFKEGPVGDILKKVRSGDKVSDANVASKFFKPGAVGEESATRFMNAIGDDKVAKQAITDAVKQDLLASATNPATGELTEAKLKTWLSKYNPALKKLGIKGEFSSIESSRKVLTEAIEMKTAFDKSVASKMLNADVDKAISSAFKSGSKRIAAGKIMSQLKGDRKAIAGAQNALIDHIIEKSKNAGVDILGNRVVSMAKLKNLNREFKPAMDVMFKNSPEKIRALKNYRKAFETLYRDQLKAVGGGSNTMDKMVSVVQTMSSLSGSRLVHIGKALMKPFKEVSEQNVNKFLNRAAVDPDFAFTLKMIADDRPVDLVAQKLKGNMAAMGVRYRTKKTKNSGDK